MGIYARTVLSCKSRTTCCSAVSETSLDRGELVETDFSSKAGPGERIFSIRVVVGSESVLGEVSEK